MGLKEQVTGLVEALKGVVSEKDRVSGNVTRHAGGVSTFQTLYVMIDVSGLSAGTVLMGAYSINTAHQRKKPLPKVVAGTS